jgi:glucokinase
LESLERGNTALATWLVADIGGTNARFALLSSAGKIVGEVGYMRCADYPGPAEAASEFLHRAGNYHPQIASFAVAAAVNAKDSNSVVKITNNTWVFSREKIKAALGLEHLLIINDFEALALSLSALNPGQYQIFSGPSQLKANATKAVIGPGTGLGVAGLVPTAHGWIAVAGEGGHATLAATEDFEADVLRIVRREFAHVSAERLLSGIGLPTLYRAVAQILDEQRDALAPDQIAQLAESGDAVALKTIQVFCALLGSFAGSVALTFGAHGGVYIGGGIVPKLGKLFVQSAFRERFEAKGRFREYLAAIPTPLLVAPDLALTGAGQAIKGFIGGREENLSGA